MNKCEVLHQEFTWEDASFCYLPSCKVTVNSLWEKVSGLVEEEALLEGHRRTTKAGGFGDGRVAVSLPSMKTTFNMVGRSHGSSCTHNSPTFKHFKYSSRLQFPLSVCSIKSKPSSFIHKSQA